MRMNKELFTTLYITYVDGDYDRLEYWWQRDKTHLKSLIIEGIRRSAVVESRRHKEALNLLGVEIDG